MIARVFPHSNVLIRFSFSFSFFLQFFENCKLQSFRKYIICTEARKRIYVEKVQGYRKKAYRARQLYEVFFFFTVKN